jgi:hypothetical protein
MNPEIHTIIEDMKRRSPKNPIASSDIQNYLQVQNSNLLVLLAEEAEKTAQKNEMISNRILFLTWVIVVLTAVLVFTVFFEVPKITIQQSQKPKLSTEQTDKNNNKQNINIPSNDPIQNHK